MQCKCVNFYTGALQTISQLELQNDFDMAGDSSANKPDPPTCYVNFHCSDIEQEEQKPNPDQAHPSPATLEPQPQPFHTLILDLAGVCFIDLMGIKVLTKVRSWLVSRHRKIRRSDISHLSGLHGT